MSDVEEDEILQKYKPVGEKKTLAEYNQLDAQDESLKKWKASLGIVDGEGSAEPIADSSDKRKLVVLQLGLQIGSNPIEWSDPTVAGKARKFPEKETWSFHLKFRVQHEIMTGLYCKEVTKRGGIKVRTVEKIIGSFPPNTTAKPEYEKAFEPEVVPSGFIARGKYSSTLTIYDIDDEELFSYSFPFEIIKSK